MCALPTRSWLPLCTKICAHMTCFLPGMSLDYCCGLPLLNSATKSLCCNNPSLVTFILVVLPLPSHTAFVDVLACVQSCSGVTVTEVTAPREHRHKCWHRCKWMLLPQELTHRNSSSPLPCVSALCFHLEPLREPQKRRWYRELRDPHCRSRYFWEKRWRDWPSKTITGLPRSALITQGYEDYLETWRENCLWLSPYYMLDWIYWHESHSSAHLRPSI